MINYILSGNNQTKVVAATGKGGIKIRFARENGQKFFRAKLSGSLTLTGDDYHFVKGALNSCCSTIAFRIEQEGETVAKAVIDPYSVAYSDSLCKAVIDTFNVDDAYTGIFANWDRSINVMQLTDLVSYYDGTTTHERGRWLIGLVHWLLKETVKNSPSSGCVRTNGTGYSAFFEADLDPIKGGTNRNKRLLIEQLGDARYPDATQPTQTAQMTLKELLNELRTLFNVWWDIDANGYFRLEHEQFYDLGYQYAVPDVSSLLDIRHVGTGAGYRYDKTNVYGAETLELPSNERLLDSDTFINVPDLPLYYKAGIEYENCVPVNAAGEVERNGVSSNWYTYYDALKANTSDSIGRTGWVLVHLVLNGSTWNIHKDGLNLLNPELLAHNLFLSYHTWGRSYPTGRVNAFQYDFGSSQGEVKVMRFTKPNRVWEPITRLVCGFSELIKPTYPVRFAGEPDKFSYIQESEWDISKGIQTLTVVSAGLCHSGPLAYNASNGACIPAGTFIRSVSNPPRQNAPCTKTEFYADGNCGEYPVLKAC